MDNRTFAIGFFGVGGLFLAIQLLTIVLVLPFDVAYQPVENPENPINALIYIGAILVATGLMLLAIKYDLDQAIRGAIILASGLLSWYVFAVLVPPNVLGLGFNLLTLIGAGGVVIALALYPEWWVLDTAGIFMGAGGAALFGISFGLFPAIVLLGILAIYDAISVYKTKHMLSLAEGVLELRVPVLLIVPTTWPYTILGEDGISTPGLEDDESNDRDAIIVGLGDAVIPTVLVASAVRFSTTATLTIGPFSAPLPAITAIGGTFVGLGILLWMVLKGRAHAGLPLLNGGTIAGYLLGVLLVGQSLYAGIGLG